MRRLFFLLILAIVFVTDISLLADEYRPAYLELKQKTEQQFTMLWKVPSKGQNQRLSLYVDFSSDVSIVSEPTSTLIAGAYIERSIIEHPNGLTGAEIHIQGLMKVSTDVLVRIQRRDGTSETARLNATTTSFVVKGTPELWDVLNTYLVFGIEHILGGFDHLFFVACLIFIAGSLRRILITITGFTIAHSITLTIAALELIELPIPPIEATIALSIVFLAREIALDRRGTLTWRYPVSVSATFGLLHGFGFASALNEIGLPQTEIPTALLAFNVGVEIGQVIFVLSISIIFRFIDYYKINIEKPLAYTMGIISMYWTIERVANFW